MKTIIEINGSNYGSTGNIAINIAKTARKNGYDVYNFCNISRESLKHTYQNQIYYGIWLERIISERLSYITGLRDHFNIFGTIDLILKIKKIKPDLIHMHVLHDNFLNFKILFQFLGTINIPVIWTFHDCSSLTGQCPCFDIVNCEKWKTICNNCPQVHVEPKSLIFDTTKLMWKYKRKCFTSIKNLTIVTPSKWLSNLVYQSYFKSFDIRIINNGIDLNVFKPINSDFKTKYKIESKYLLLGVANYWGKRKGLDVFIELAKTLSSDFQIVLVGTNDDVDKILPPNIISIHRTFNKQELVEIYSSADLFVNPTREDNFPTVNIEALACGIPIVTFNTGGSPEIIDQTCGFVVEKNNINALVEKIIYTCKNKPFNKDSCIKRSQCFDMNETFIKYVNLFNEKIKLK